MLLLRSVFFVCQTSFANNDNKISNKKLNNNEINEKHFVAIISDSIKMLTNSVCSASYRHLFFGWTNPISTYKVLICGCTVTENSGFKWFAQSVCFNSHCQCVTQWQRLHLLFWICFLSLRLLPLLIICSYFSAEIHFHWDTYCTLTVCVCVAFPLWRRVDL